MRNDNNLRMYHKQAKEDKYAKKNDDYTGYTTANLKDIKEAYKEFMQELMLESQEAY